MHHNRSIDVLSQHRLKNQLFKKVPDPALLLRHQRELEQSNIDRELVDDLVDSDQSSVRIFGFSLVLL